MSTVVNFYERQEENTLKTLLLFVGFVVVLCLFGYFIGYIYNDSQYLVPLAFLFSLTTSFFSYYFSDSVILSLSKATVANKKQYFDYYSVVENICLGTGLPMPRLYVINDTSPNAFATGRDKNHATIVATTGLLDQLSRPELEGVMAHELSHVGNNDMLLMTVVAVLVGTVVMVMDWFWRVRVRINDNDNKQAGAIFMILALLFAILTPIIAQLIKFAISRQREFMADATAVRYTRNPNGLISALTKVASSKEPLEVANKATAHLYFENPLDNVEGDGVGRFKNLFSTHPPVSERIKRLKAM
ncbi:M48 family metallopeptidase [Candidatus Parcubacteria bacterium]|nr:M48 family metallopeptidase [Patescibacteria group bacterium]MBU4380700.1 M48 family metallopeptidase [Patescibacteria group bacterium]MCG2689617.1 M48 family metallopeptidase [Candidatus Parcubacteria bacterium]